MIPSLKEIVLSIYGAWCLARFDVRGLTYFATSPGAVWRSFFAAVIIAPLYAGALAIRFNNLPDATDPMRFLIIESLSYVVTWIAYPVLMDPISTALGRRDRLARYVTIYNWSMILQHAIFLPIATLSTFTDVDPGLNHLLLTAALVAVVLYIWFIARVGLGISPLKAIVVVIADISLSLVISIISSSMYQPAGFIYP